MGSANTFNGEKFSKSLRELMENSGITNYRLSAELPCSKSSVANWLSGKVPSASTLSRLADYFGVSIGVLVGEPDKFFVVRKNKKTATPEGDGMSDKDARFLAWFRSLPIETQKSILYDANAPEGLV